MADGSRSLIAHSLSVLASTADEIGLFAEHGTLRSSGGAR